MRRISLQVLAGCLALAPSLCKAQTTTGTYTVAASNVTMPSSGTTTIPFTLTSVHGFMANLAVDVTAPTVPPGVKLPYLEIGGPVRLYPLAANATLKASIGVLSAVPVPVPVKFTLPRRPANSHATVWSLAGAFLLFLGLRRRRLAAAPLLLTLALLLGLTTLTACGGPPTLTPGTYTYTLTATQVTNSQNIASSGISTTFTLTVPPGIVTK